jgi:hypothetical protein
MTRSQLARDVASELDSRRRRRKVSFYALLVAAIAAAVMYLRCGSGWGLGGTGKGDGKGPGAGPGSAQTQGPKRCVVRVAASGITVDGKEMKRDEAVAACKQTEGALITVTGDARQGDWDELKAALEQAKVPIFTRGDR